jgi:aldose 1-epimerase
MPPHAEVHDSPVYPSGRQFEISYGDQRATIVEVGGGVRSYDRGGRAVLEAYDRDVASDGAHGAVLLPWPNRLADGKYRFDDVDYQVGLTEPAKSNAIHGFLMWQSFEGIEQSASRVVMATVLRPRDGYPFHLDVHVAYELGGDGMTVATTATNIGDKTCPYGCGQHPYLSPGAGLIDDCTLQFGAATQITTDPDRQLPTGRRAVAGTPFDFSQPRRLGDTKLDTPFTDLTRDAAGRAWVRLSGSDGQTVGLWVDQHYPLIELFTGDTLSSARRRRGLGAEPMSCPPNAFQSGESIIRLAPGESITTRWGVGLL